MADNTKKAVKTVSFITIAILAAKVLGMLRDVVFAQMYGTSMQSDAYLSASRIPLLFFDLTLGAAVLSTFIPVFNRHLQTDRKKAINFANTFLNIVLLISIAFCVIAMIFSKQITGLFAPGLSAEGASLASGLLIIMLPTAIFTAVAYVFVGILQSLDEFTVPALISLVSNGGLLVYMFFFNRYFGIYGMAVAFLISWSLQIIIQVPALIKKKYRYSLHLNFREEGLKDVVLLAVPILISSWVQPVCVTVNTRFASYLGEGAIAAMDYANKLYIIIVGVFTFAITNYIFPQLSRQSGNDDKEGFAVTMKTAFSSMLAIIVPVAVGMALFALPIIKTVYQRGEFDDKSAVMTASALSFFSIGMVGLGINEILNKCFYAMKNGKTPMYASIVGIVADIVLAWLLYSATPLGVGGLALAASAALAIIAVILMACIHKKIGLFDKRVVSVIIKIIVASVLMAAVSIPVNNFTHEMNIYLNLVLTVAAGGAAYLAAIFALGVVKDIKR